MAMVIEEMDQIVIQGDKAVEVNSWIMVTRFGFILHPIVVITAIVVVTRTLVIEEEDVVELMVDSMSISHMEVVIVNMDTLEIQGTIAVEEGGMDRVEVVGEEGMDPEMVVMVDPEDLHMEVGEVHVVEVAADIINAIIVNHTFHGNSHQMITVEIAMTDLQEIGIASEEIETSDDGL